MELLTILMILELSTIKYLTRYRQATQSMDLQVLRDLGTRLQNGIPKEEKLNMLKANYKVLQERQLKEAKKKMLRRTTERNNKHYKAIITPILTQEILILDIHPM